VDGIMMIVYTYSTAKVMISSRGVDQEHQSPVIVEQAQTAPQPDAYGLMAWETA